MMRARNPHLDSITIRTVHDFRVLGLRLLRGQWTHPNVHPNRTIPPDSTIFGDRPSRFSRASRPCFLLGDHLGHKLHHGLR
eukprot:9320200-Pyramimonas_sp.AAC.1